MVRHFFKEVRIKKILLLLLLFNTFVYSQSSIDGLLKEGLKYSYNLELEKAENYFNQIIKKFPEDPRGYHYKSSIYIWSYLGNSEKQNLNLFLNYSDQAIEKAENLLDEDNKNEIANYILGSSYGYRAIAFGKAEKYLEMIWASQKSNTYLKNTLKINSNNYDAYLGLGLFKFALSQVPSAFKWALNLIGFEGNQEEGLNFLILASERGNYAKAEADYYLSQIYSEFYFDFDKSSYLLKNLSQKYPQNILFLYSLAVVDIKRKDLNSAEKFLQKLIKIDNHNFLQTISFSNFLMGDVLFRKNKFENAKQFYQTFIKTSSIKDYLGIANYRLGLCYELTGDYSIAINYYKQSGNGLEILDDDSYAKRKGLERLNSPMNEVEKKIIIYSNLIETDDSKLAADSLSSLLEIAESEKFKNEIKYYLAQAYLELQQYEIALNYALSPSVSNEKNESWLKPFSLFIIAKCYWKLNNPEKALDYLDKTEEQTDYDYKSKLKGMINNLKSRLKS